MCAWSRTGRNSRIVFGHPDRTGCDSQPGGRSPLGRGHLRDVLRCPALAKGAPGRRGRACACQILRGTAGTGHRDHGSRFALPQGQGGNCRYKPQLPKLSLVEVPRRRSSVRPPTLTPGRAGASTAHLVTVTRKEGNVHPPPDRSEILGSPIERGRRFGVEDPR